MWTLNETGTKSIRLLPFWHGCNNVRFCFVSVKQNLVGIQPDKFCFVFKVFLTFQRVSQTRGHCGFYDETPHGLSYVFSDIIMIYNQDSFPVMITVKSALFFHYWF